MAAQQEAFSTALPLIELQNPTFPNKINLIDPVYKKSCATVNGPQVPSFSGVIYSLCFRCLGQARTACGEGKLGLFNSLQRRGTAERKFKRLQN